jgi:hypothetical protein
MRFYRTGICGVSAFALLAGCSGNVASPSTSPLSATRAASWRGDAIGAPAIRHSDGALHGLPAPQAAKDGIYVSEFFGTNVFGYPKKNVKKHKPSCTVPWTSSSVNDVAVDGTGALIVPDPGDAAIDIGTGPGMCGPESQSIPESYGYPSDAASYNAATGSIVVGNFRDNPSFAYPGSVTVCTVAAGCTSNLTNSNILGVVGVALDKHGNCWASSESQSAAAVLVYFAKCSGGGVVATGFQDTAFGGLDIDRSGNLVSIDETANGTGQVWVYKGCNPACTVVGGPFPLNGESTYGHLNAKGNRFAVADIAYGQVDIYSYSPAAVKYLYSFSKGLRASYEVQSVVYNPSSMK